MKVEYPCFTYNNEVFIIIPGSRFSRNELKTRLKIMGIVDTNNLNKTNLIDLYESSLKNNQNRLKILPQLRKDTDNINSKVSLSQRQSLPPNMISTNISQNKVMNISCEVNPFNSREQQINIVKPMHTNKGQYSQNPFISSNISQNQSSNTFNYEFSSNNINQISNNNSNNYDKNNNINLDSTYNFNNTNSNNNNSSYIGNQEIYIKKNNDNSIISNSNNSRIFNQKVEEQINRESNNSKNIPNIMRNNINKNSNLSINNIIFSKQYEEDINNNILNSSNNNINNNNNTNKTFTFQANNDMNNTNNDYNNDINDNNKKTFTNRPEQIQYLHLNQRLPSDEISDNENNNNNPYKNNLNNNNNNKIYNNEINNSNYNQEILIKSQRNNFLNNEENNVVENNIRQIRQRDPDELSTFSFFSTFSNLKNYPFYKNRKFICLHTIILILILCFTIAILQLITYSWDSIIDFFSNFFELLLDPGRLIEVIGSFFSSIFFGAINYYYITIPLLIFAFIAYIRLKKYLFKQKIKELLNKIIKDLNNNSISNENRAISEDNIYEKYLKNNGVSYREFRQKYIPAMKKMKRNEPRLKLSSIINNNKEIVFWELSG